MLGIARDDREVTRTMLQEGLTADVIITSGGVSVGDHDFVKEVIEELGGELKFWKINMKPGKPLAFAVVAGKPLFALPGNPVAAMVGFEMFVRPALLAMMGHTRIIRPLVRAVATEPIRNKGDRPHLIRALVELQEGRYHLKTTGDQGSARLSSLTLGNALVLVPSEAVFNVGDEVDASLLDRSFEMQE
jgi:molybdopterin molybdotransferase